MVALTILVVWLGRRHWARVGKSMFRRAVTPEDRRNRNAGWMFGIGIIGLCAWFVWAGMPLKWAVLCVGVAFVASIIVGRIVAETGLPYVRAYGAYPSVFLVFMPQAWLTHATILLQQIVAVLFHVGSRVSPMAMATHALGTEDEGPADQQMRRSRLMVVLLVAGLLVCGVASLWINYRHNAPLQGSPPINAWGANQFVGVYKTVKQFDAGRFLPKRRYDQRVHMLTGAAVAAGLQVACLNIPKWPLHPIGLLIVDSHYSRLCVASVFFGWLIKVLVLKYGGSRMFRSAQPAFLGLFMGEIIAGIFWILVAVLLAACGLAFQGVWILPG
jgi:hypothetical protein